MLRSDDQYCRARKVVKRLEEKVDALKERTTYEERHSGEYDELLNRFWAGCEEIVAYEWNFWTRHSRPRCS